MSHAGSNIAPTTDEAGEPTKECPLSLRSPAFARWRDPCFDGPHELVLPILRSFTTLGPMLRPADGMLDFGGEGRFHHQGSSAVLPAAV